MQRALWNRRYFTNHHPIHYNCPKCKIGNLVRIAYSEKIRPGQAEMEEHGYPYGIGYIFTALLQCNTPNCETVVSLLGRADKDIVNGFQLPDGNWVENRIHQFFPQFFYPPLEIITVSNQVPKPVSEQLKLSFSHFFHDLSSCANRLRNSIELIMDDLKAPKKKRNKYNKLVAFRTLHDRITNYKEKGNKRISDLLLAIKIIGNEGSHIGSVSQEDILDAYEFTEAILDYVYDKKNKAAHTKAMDIVLKNIPRSKHN